MVSEEKRGMTINNMTDKYLVRWKQSNMNKEEIRNNYIRRRRSGVFKRSQSIRTYLTCIFCVVNSIEH